MILFPKNWGHSEAEQAEGLLVQKFGMTAPSEAKCPHSEAILERKPAGIFHANWVFYGCSSNECYQWLARAAFLKSCEKITGNIPG